MRGRAVHLFNLSLNKEFGKIETNKYIYSKQFANEYSYTRLKDAFLDSCLDPAFVQPCVLHLDATARRILRVSIGLPHFPFYFYLHALKTCEFRAEREVSFPSQRARSLFLRFSSLFFVFYYRACAGFGSVGEHHAFVGLGPRRSWPRRLCLAIEWADTFTGAFVSAQRNRFRFIDSVLEHRDGFADGARAIRAMAEFRHCRISSLLLWDRDCSHVSIYIQRGPSLLPGDRDCSPSGWPIRTMRTATAPPGTHYTRDRVCSLGSCIFEDRAGTSGTATAPTHHASVPGPRLLP